MTLSGYDAWVTREPPDVEPRALHCVCGRFLKQTPDATRSWVVLDWCSGEPKVLDCVYGETPGDEGLLAILGEEFRGRSYRVAYPPECGGMEPSRHRTFDGDVSPDDVGRWRHEPHFFAEEFGYQEVALRTCVCGRVNEEALT